MLFIERVRTISILFLTVFGCIGNLLTLIIVNQRVFRKTASSAFISGLCIADCIVLCLHSLQIVTKLHPQVTSYDCIVFFLMDVFRLLSVWIVCFMFGGYRWHMRVPVVLMHPSPHCQAIASDSSLPPDICSAYRGHWRY